MPCSGTGSSLSAGPTHKCLRVEKADGLRINQVIVPQFVTLNFQIDPHASATEYDLFIAQRALQVVDIDVVPSIAQGGALTGTLVKAIGTATPVKTTTPLHAADAIDFNAAAYTVQSITLSATVADLKLAAGDRIGIDFSAALTTGKAVVTILAKYI